MVGLEEFFDMHRERLRQAEPPVGHEQRFMQRLQQRHRYSLRRVVMQVASSAAVALLALGLTGVLAWRTVGGQYLLRQATSTDMAHYVNLDQMNLQLHQIEQLARSCHPDMLPEVNRLRHELESEHQALRRNLRQASPSTLNMLVEGQHAQMQAIERLRLALEANGCNNIDN